jgi:transposase
MTVAVTDEQRVELETAVRASRNVRHWKRYQAVLLRAAGTPVAVVAKTLGCCEDRVTNWTNAWQAEGLAGVNEGRHPGAARRLDGGAEPR